MVDAKLLTKYITQAVRLRLSGYEYLLALTPEQLLKIVNGIGPESFPAWLRNLIDYTNPTMLVAAIIHDLRYTYGTGTRLDFLAANAELEANGKLLADDNYCFLNPMRYLVKLRAHEFRVACDKFGWPAYEAAIAARVANPDLNSVPSPQ